MKEEYKKIIYLFLLTISVYAFSSYESFAENLETPFITESNISVDKEQSFGLNEASILFSPESSNDEIKTKGLDFAGGNIVCKTSGKDAYCDWVIKVKGDYINVSNVEVILKKDSDFLNGGCKTYKNYFFNYRLYTPSPLLKIKQVFIICQKVITRHTLEEPSELLQPERTLRWQVTLLFSKSKKSEEKMYELDPRM